MKKLLLIPFGLMLMFGACKKKTPPNPEPEEYFSFYADGKYYNYPQEKNLAFSGTGQTLKASGSGTGGYNIRGYSLEKPAASGAVRFTLSVIGFPNKDTFLLDGISNLVSVLDFKTFNNNYAIGPPLKGKIVFTERNNQKLKGTFEFRAGQSGGDTLTITNGKFSIIPTKK